MRAKIVLGWMLLFSVLRISFCLFLLIRALSAFGQQAAANNATVVPPLVNFSGTLTDINGKPLTGVVGVTFSLYNDQQALSPLWLETQNVTPNKNGHYSVQLGATSSTGLPADIFVAGEARWLGVQPQGQAEYPRVMLLSVPYALKAGDAQTIGGLPASAFLLAPSAAGTPSSTRTGGSTPLTSGPVTGSGTVNFLPLWDSTSDIISSALFQSGSAPTAMLGLNTATPSATLDVATGDVLLEAGNLDLPQTTSATNGVITLGGVPFIYACCSSTSFNTYVGANAGSFNILSVYGTVPSYNTAVGYKALTTNTGNTNTAIGTSALTANTTGNSNTAVGTSSLPVNTQGSSNTAVGTAALESTGIGSENTAVGDAAGLSNTSGSNNTFVGQGADAATQTLNYAVAIGSGAVVGESHALVLGGTVANGNAVNVGIGTPTPAYTLDVQGTANFTGPITFASGQTFPGTGNGTITGVTTGGGGLAGGATSGNVNLALTSCANGQVLESNGSSWACAPLSTGGTITGVATPPGSGLTGGATSGNVTLNVDSTQVPFLNAPNTFTQSQTVSGNLTATGPVTGSSYQIGSNLFAFGSYANGNAFVGFSGGTSGLGTNNTANGLGALASTPAAASSKTGQIKTLTGTFVPESSYNSATGSGALGSNTVGYANTAEGALALNLNTGGFANTAEGYGALQQNTNGTRNTANGVGALIYNTTGTQNTGLGFLAGVGTTSFNLSNATAIGAFSEVDANNALVLGSIAGLNDCTASFNCVTTNVGIGTSTPQYNLDVHGTANFTGLVTFAPNQTFPGGSGSVTSVGSGAGLLGGPITSSGTLSVDPTQVPFLVANNTFTGSQTVNGNLSSTGIVTGSAFQIGSNLFAYGTYAKGDAFLGFAAGNPTMSGAQNTAVGFYTLSLNQSGGANTAIGADALATNIFGSFNTASGVSALGLTNSGNNNTAAGVYALAANDGSSNTANGAWALFSNSYGFGNTGTGFYALESNQSGSGNVADGYEALQYATGNNNIGLGAFSGNPTGANSTTVTTGSGDIYLGNSTTSGTKLNLNNATAIGAFAEVDASNSLVLGSIAGANNCTTANNCASTNVGIGTTTPQFTLDVHGTGNFTGAVTFATPVTFASNQTFPGSGGTVTSVASGAGLIGGPITSSGTLSIAPAGVTNSMLANPSLTVAAGPGLTSTGLVALGGTTTLNVDPTQVPFLVASNTFTGNQAVNGNLSATGLVTGSAFNIGSNLFAFGSYVNNNAFLGFSGNSTMSGQGNTASGYQALLSNTTGLSNTATGQFALSFNQTGNNNAATGSQALYSNTTGIDNTAMGTNALISNTGGGDNTATGSGALYYNTTGNFNTASGYLASSANTTAYDNSAFGYKTLLSNQTGADNTAAGYEALYSNTSNANTAVGSQALRANTTGSANTASGSYALSANTTGEQNTAFGGQSLQGVTTGGANTGIGTGALFSVTTGNLNTGAGGEAGYSFDSTPITGSYNSFFGTLTGTSTGTLNNATAVGSFAVVGASNSLVLGSIFGLGACLASINCTSTNVGIGTSTPAYTLDVEAPSGSTPTVNFGSASSPAAFTVQGTGSFTGLVTFAPNQPFPGTGNGTITGVKPTAGGGLMGGGNSGNIGLGLINSCAAGQVLQWSGTAWVCSTISTGGGTITGVTNGAGLTGGGTSGNVTLNVDPTQVPFLKATNNFTGTQTFNGTLEVTGSGNGVQFPDGTLQTTAATSGGGIPSGYMILGNSSTAPPGYTLTGILGGTGQWSAGPEIPLAKPPASSAAALVNGAIDFVGPRTLLSGQSVLGNLLSWDTFGGWVQMPVLGNIPLFTRSVTAVEANGLLWAIMGTYDTNPGQVCSYASSDWTCVPLPRAEAAFAVAVTAVGSDPLIEVIGGQVRNSTGSGASNLVQIFDTLTGQWGYSSLPNPLAQAAAATLNGKVYVFGGHGSFPLGSSPCISSTNAAFVLGGASIANIPVNLFGASATVFNGKVYLIGGTTCVSTPSGGLTSGPGNLVFIYDPASNTWNSGLPMPVTPALGFSAVTLNGKIFVIDGSSLSAWEYAPPVYMFTKN